MNYLNDRTKLREWLIAINDNITNIASLSGRITEVMDIIASEGELSSLANNTILGRLSELSLQTSDVDSRVTDTLSSVGVIIDNLNNKQQEILAQISAIQSDVSTLFTDIQSNYETLNNEINQLSGDVDVRLDGMAVHKNLLLNSGRFMDSNDRNVGAFNADLGMIEFANSTPVSIGEYQGGSSSFGGAGAELSPEIVSLMNKFVANGRTSPEVGAAFSVVSVAPSDVLSDAIDINGVNYFPTLRFNPNSIAQAGSSYFFGSWIKVLGDSPLLISTGNNEVWVDGQPVSDGFTVDSSSQWIHLEQKVTIYTDYINSFPSVLMTEPGTEYLLALPVLDQTRIGVHVGVI